MGSGDDLLETGRRDVAAAVVMHSQPSCYLLSSVAVDMGDAR